MATSLDASAEIRQFAAGLAHSMANVLSSLSMNAELSCTCARRGETERAGKLIDRVVEDCDRANKMIRDLQYAAAAMECIPVERTSLRSTMEAAIASVRSVRGRDFAETAIDLTDLDANPEVDGSVEGVFVQVLMNALDSGADRVAITAEISHHEVSINIKDNGHGISAAVLPKIFDPFFTTRKEQGHTGIGLTITRYVLARNNGTVKILSAPDGGTEVVVTLRKHS